MKYPNVVAPEKTKLNWVDDSYFIAHGRYDNFDAPKTYEMVAVLNDEFDLINYNPYKGQTHDKDWARATLSFELVDQHNNASKIGDGHDSGIRLYQGEDNKWYIALDPTDAGRAWINAADAKDLKKIKMRAVVSSMKILTDCMVLATRKPMLITSMLKKLTITSLAILSI